MGRTSPFRGDGGKIRSRRNPAVHHGVNEGRVGALLRTSIIAACTTYAIASCLRAYWVETSRNTLLGQAVSVWSDTNSVEVSHHR